MARLWLPVRGAVATTVIVATVAVVLLAGCASGRGTTAQSGPASRAATGTIASGSVTPGQATAGPATATPHPVASPSELPVAPGAGGKPQTSAFPRTRSAPFRHAMAAGRLLNSRRPMGIIGHPPSLH